MPSKVNRNIDVSQILKDIQARLTKLESFPPSGIKVLSNTGSFGTGALAYASTTTTIVASQTPSVTIGRQVPLMAVGSLNFSTPTVGTATGVLVGLTIVLGGVTSFGGESSTMVPSATANFDATRVLVIDGAAWAQLAATIPAFPMTAVALWTYAMLGGATTTIQAVQGTVELFQLSG